MATYEDCAQAVLDTVPLVMRSIRNELRSHRNQDLSIPQFRILMFVKNHTEPSISDVAEHIGLTLPTLSKMIDLLVARQWVTRTQCLADRRRMQLGLTERGQAMLAESLASTRANLAECFEGLPENDLDRVIQAMQLLQELFSSERAAQTLAAQKR
jgi:DNA-binding MarR family transcriptional regulator